MNLGEFFLRPFADPVLVFATVMVLILVAPALARKVRLPEIVGLIVAGIAVGPHGLGLLERGESIELLGKVGLLYIMFLAGLEIDMHQVRRNRHHTILFGLITFSIPLAMGIALGLWIFGMTIPVAILLASMFSSHTLLTFPAVTKLGLTGNRAVTSAVGGTIITDTLALLVLAIVVSSSRGDINTAFWIRFMVLIVVYLAATIVLIPIAGKLFFRRMGSDETVEFVFVIALTFVVSFGAHLAGLEPIIGAFLAGLSLNRLIPEKSLLMSRIRFTGDAIFIPFFLLSVGMLVDLRLLASGADVWIVIAGMSFVALLSKWLAARLSALLLKYRTSEAGLLYGLSVNQAAATLAAVLIAYDIGLFSDRIVTGTVIMIAVTCLVGSIVSERAGRRLASEVEQAPYDRSTAQERILIPIGARQGSRELLDVALLAADGGGSEPVYPVRVVYEDADVESELADAEQILAHTVVRGLSLGLPVTPLTVVDVSIGSGLARAVRDNRVSLVVCSWDADISNRAHGFGRAIDQVIDRTRVMMVINRLYSPVNASERLLLLLPPLAERQAGFERVIGTAKRLAHQTGTSLLVLATPETLQTAGGFLESARPEVPVRFETIRAWKRVLETVVDYSETGDWILMVTGRKGEISWQPNMERLPGSLAALLEDRNVSVIVPPAEPWDSVQIAGTDMEVSQLVAEFSADRSVFAMNEKSTRDAVYRLLANYFGRRSVNARAVSDLLVRISREEPVALVDDVVLLHTHVPFVSDTVVFLGVNKDALDIPGHGEGPHIIVILLDPVGQDPARHLKALADIARVIRLPGLIESLRSFTSFGQFRDEVEKRMLDYKR